MNVKYFKRQIILKNFGIPMSEDVQRMYNHFMSLIGDINEYEIYNEKERGYSDNIFWLKDGNIIFRFNTEERIFWISSSVYYKNFFGKYESNLTSMETCKIAVSILEDLLDIYVEDLTNHPINRKSDYEND